MIRGFKYRFCPTPEQELSLARTFGSVRYVYNWALHLRSQAWHEKRQRINYVATSCELSKLKRQPETAWLNDVSSVPTQQCLRHLQSAFVNFWKKRTNYPTFKKKHGLQSAEFTRSAFKWQNGELTVAKIGKLKIRWSKFFSGEPSTVTISRSPSGRYLVVLRVDEPLPKLRKTEQAVGIDLGLSAFATTSLGSKSHAPRPLRRKRSQLKRAQKALSRKRKGSKNRAKARLRLAKIHQTISDIRNDFLHKLSTRLVRENQTIVTEDLNVRGMLANHRLAQSIGDSGWGEFFRQLEYKCEWYGRKMVKIDRFYPSSKRCSRCGHIADSMPLHVRSWACEKCGTEHDRDLNAAINLLAAGHAVAACGDGVRPPRSQGRTGNRLRSRNRSVSRP